MAPRVQVAQIEIHRRQSLEATVHRACRDCGAPARYLSHPSIQSGWPGCWVTAGDPRDGEFVLNECPNCGTTRDQVPEELGEIWAREWQYPGILSWARWLVAMLHLPGYLWSIRRDWRFPR